MIIKAVTGDKTDYQSIQKALKEAQIDILDGAEFEFENKLIVAIEKEDPDLPEVTLIDLPGVFFAKTDDADELEDKVKSMISERVNNNMSLILHVIPLNQDIDTISTWRRWYYLIPSHPNVLWFTEQQKSWHQMRKNCQWLEITLQSFI